MEQPLFTKKIRVVIAKPGLDGHDTGAKVVIHALKDAGMEVIYTGLHRTIEEIVTIAIDEDVDVIGLSIYSGAHLPLSEKLMNKLNEQGITDKIILVGGNIPHKDVITLESYGVSAVFPIGARLDRIVQFIEDKVKEKNEKR